MINFRFLFLQRRDNLKYINNGKKIVMIHYKENRARMVARWFKDGLRATGFQLLQDTSYNVINHGSCSAFVERWHEENSSFHISFGERTVTLDDVSCLLHLSIKGMLLTHKVKCSRLRLLT